jgi:hypothetical protein
MNELTAIARTWGAVRVRVAGAARRTSTWMPRLAGAGGRLEMIDCCRRRPDDSVPPATAPTGRDQRMSDTLDHGEAIGQHTDTRTGVSG